MSPIAMMRRTIRIAQSAERYGEAVFDNGARPAVVMTHPKTLTTGAVERLGAQMDSLRGSGNAGKTVVLEEGLSIAEVGFPPEDAQFMETRLFQKRDLAGYYDVPGLMVGDPDEKETWDDASRRFMSAIQSDLERFEQEGNRQLVLEDEEDIYIEFKAEGWLRADPKARADANAVQWEHGNLSNDEWRRSENMDPLPNQLGEVYYRPANWVPLGPEPVAVGGDASTDTQFGQPGQGEPAPDDSPAEVVDQTTRAKSVRCPSCGKLLIPELEGSVKMVCHRCKAEVAA
jgi:phage portal protein BeeE